ncbi:hypothetical protein GCG21_13550 [Pseudactinotalea sp. HY160]|uniref:uroporphyrinogen-III synthase n=1 Tax=Pseudactinotalea sp. HY160 TaxID=2654490 RepID=UPI00128C9C77|nr:uroporphyrinogen-III synthase [Pseudactinotalea sp. HY160]MPV51012.1 hypothetical protein [Pseudactinotalea sp. HY160]
MAVRAAGPRARVLVPRAGEWGRRVAGLVETLAQEEGVGAEAWIVPLIRTLRAPAGPLEAAATRVASGRYDWIVVTSGAAAPALAAWHVPATTHVAAVGPATARALAEIGWRVDLTPRSATAAALAAALGEEIDGTGAGTGTGTGAGPGTGGRRILLPHSDLAHPTLAADLAARGCTVEEVTAYLTRTAPLGGDDAARLRAGEADAALVTSGSVARALAAVPIGAGTALVCLGDQTARDAHAAGLTVTATAAAPSMRSLVTTALGHLPAPTPPHR